eukprot:Mycagemm_TRINITY_DN10387_c0_g2::TRINITY_DN10387_c0_g2_i5::g.502::m.502 type:complete len:152 gc:universal TRINITY_DN10387_c0_g2_i5:657-1112(+)
MRDTFSVRHLQEQPGLQELADHDVPLVAAREDDWTWQHVTLTIHLLSCLRTCCSSSSSSSSDLSPGGCPWPPSSSSSSQSDSCGAKIISCSTHLQCLALVQRRPPCQELPLGVSHCFVHLVHTVSLLVCAPRYRSLLWNLINSYVCSLLHN